MREKIRKPDPLLTLRPQDVPHRTLTPTSPFSSPASNRSVSPGGGGGGIDSLSDYQKLSELGRGSGGIVHKVRHRKTGVVYALKEVRYGGPGLREAEIFRRVGSTSEHVVRCFGVFDGDFAEADGGNAICFVMEYMDGGSLQEVLRKKAKFGEREISGVVGSVLKGLKYLHGIKIVHRDIKPTNLLVNMRGRVKIADFGASRAENGGDRAENGECRGTRAYMSPERMDPERWDNGGECDGYAGDVWALGVVAMECYVGRFPLARPGEDLDWLTLMWRICFEENVESAVGTASPEFESFCRRCLEREWRRRGTVEELLDHPFLQNYEAIGMEGVDSNCVATNHD